MKLLNMKGIISLIGVVALLSSVTCFANTASTDLCSQVDGTWHGSGSIEVTVAGKHHICHIANVKGTFVGPAPDLLLDQRMKHIICEDGTDLGPATFGVYGICKNNHYSVTGYDDLKSYVGTLTNDGAMELHEVFTFSHGGIAGQGIILLKKAS